MADENKKTRVCLARGTAGKQDYGTDGRLYCFRQDI